MGGDEPALALASAAGTRAAPEGEPAFARLWSSDASLIRITSADQADRLRMFARQGDGPRRSSRRATGIEHGSTRSWCVLLLRRELAIIQNETLACCVPAASRDCQARQVRRMLSR